MSYMIILYKNELFIINTTHSTCKPVALFTKNLTTQIKISQPFKFSFKKDIHIFFISIIYNKYKKSFCDILQC